MTPILITRAQISDASWNEHIGKSLQCVIYAQTFYLDIVCESWKALVWPSIAQPEIVMPIPVRRKLGLAIIYQPHFCQYLGLFSLKPLSSFQLESFLRLLSKEFSYISAYHFNPENSLRMSAMTTAFPELEFSQKHTDWLPIANQSQLYAGYSSDRKRNLRLGKDFHWEVQDSSDIEPLIRLFKENQTARIPGGVRGDTFIRLKVLFETLYKRRQAEICYASMDGQIHAGILVTKFAGRAMYLFNAADQKGRTGNARTVMLDHYFTSGNGETLIFDFESPEVEAIWRFYRSFGSQRVPFYAVNRNELCFPMKQIQNWRKRFFKTRQGLF